MYLENHKRKCKYCSKEFTTSKRFQLFCKDACNKYWNSHNKDYCFYCGDFAEHRDHLVPHSFECVILKRTFQNVEIVMACAECNIALGNRLFSTVAGRIKFLIRYLTKRYKLSRPCRQWDDEEIAALGYALRTWIVASQRARESAAERVLYLTHNLKLTDSAKAVPDE